MAAASSSQFDDQTDEDCFDKLIAGVAHSDQDPDPDPDLGEECKIPKEGEEEEEYLVVKENLSLDSREGGSKSRGVKVVDWSSFGFGSVSEFLADNSEDPVASSSHHYQNQIADANLDAVDGNALYWGNAQQDAAQLDANGTEYWDSMYPGWKYDHSTGQWYQTEVFNPGSSVETENYNANVQDGGGLVLEQRFENIYSQYSVGNGGNAEISYSQYSGNSNRSVVDSVGEEITQRSVSNWNQVSSTGYPANMVFDLQYPEWYYDMDTQQWCSLESYNQATQNFAAEKVQEDPGLCANHDSYVQKDWNGYRSSSVQKDMWLPGSSAENVVDFAENKKSGSFYSSSGNVVNGANGFQSFVPKENAYQFNQPKFQKTLEEHLSYKFQMEEKSVDNSLLQFQTTNGYSSRCSSGNEVRSSDGRPPHALISFGFGGKLIVMKDSSSLSSKLDFGSQGSNTGTISILNMMEVVIDKDKVDGLSSMTGGCGYFHALCQQSFPSPLAGGNAAAKDVYKWIDEKIAHCEVFAVDLRKGETLRLLLSLLKISCQHYGKLRSPFGTDPSVEETDGPASAMTKVFTSSRTNDTLLRDHGSSVYCTQGIPSEGQIRATVLEVQNLLIYGRRKDAFHCALAGQLWGPAFVLAAKLGEQYYVETVKQMAHHQFAYGSPLRTLCLLIAGQPADVFTDYRSSNSSLAVLGNESQQTTKTLGSMLDDWKENLAIITANRTREDELVIVHLGDCLWKERGDITAAHTCYLVAEANFESYSDTARLCLIGSDHWKSPRTYACPEAIQRTEIYEYAKMLGNSQFILLHFQPYKLVYAYMLAEVGKVTESIEVLSSNTKVTKNSSRAPEVDMWKSYFSSLEERLRIHLQGGYSTILGPGKLVGKLITSIDRSIHRIMSGPPSPLPSPRPPMHPSSVNGKESYTLATSQSAKAMSSLIPSASVEAISELADDSNRKTMPTRSVSEPDFGKNLKQDKSKNSSDAQGKVSPSRLGRIGSQLLQSVGWLARSRQAKLGESNKFYYNEKLKLWVEEGAEPPAQEAALPPPPTAAPVHNSTPYYNINSAVKTPNGVHGPSEAKIPSPGSSGIPPLSPSTNLFSARGRTGVRSRYVDTFNKGSRGTSPNPFPAPSVPILKPVGLSKFFVPTTTATPDQQTDYVPTNKPIQEVTSNGEPCTSSFCNVPSSLTLTPFHSPSSLTPTPFYSPSSLTPTPAMQRYQSMNNLPSSMENSTGSVSFHSRASSWSGSHGENSNHKINEPLSSFMPASPRSTSTGRNLRDELQEVAL